QTPPSGHPDPAEWAPKPRRVGTQTPPSGHYGGELLSQVRDSAVDGGLGGTVFGGGYGETRGVERRQEQVLGPTSL
ncbi:hypothetical protein, partial [Gordonia sp. UBA5067]|uniref:hypothetical protein n=1 Tax=Gordonia sp. UBA5067 TaxID=1946575 RepID=UPI0025BA41ED